MYCQKWFFTYDNIDNKISFEFKLQIFAINEASIRMLE